MTHVRTQLRNAVTVALDGIPEVSSRVFASRTHPVQRTELPCLLVFTPEESSKTISTDGLQQRKITLLVDGYAKATADLEDRLDALAASVENAFAESATETANETGFFGLAKAWELVDTNTALNGEGESSVGMIRLRFSVTVMTTEGDPETAE